MAQGDGDFSAAGRPRAKGQGRGSYWNLVRELELGEKPGWGARGVRAPTWPSSKPPLLPQVWVGASLRPPSGKPEARGALWCCVKFSLRQRQRTGCRRQTGGPGGTRRSWGRKDTLCSSALGSFLPMGWDRHVNSGATGPARSLKPHSSAYMWAGSLLPGLEQGECQHVTSRSCAGPERKQAPRVPAWLWPGEVGDPGKGSLLLCPSMSSLCLRIQRVCQGLLFPQPGSVLFRDGEP